MKSFATRAWTLASGIAFGLGFVAILQVGMVVEYGLRTEMYWQSIPPGTGIRGLVATLLGCLVGGAIFGLGQAATLRHHLKRVERWPVATIQGFCLLAILIDWPLQVLGILGRIPGPVEPILVTVGGGSLAGIFQYRVLRREGAADSRWLVLWVLGLVAGLPAAAILFISLEWMGFSPPFPLEVFLSGFSVASVGALVSSRALGAALGTTRPGSEV